MTGSSTPCNRIASASRKPNRRQVRQRWPRPPFGEHERRERDEAAACAHVRLEIGQLREDEINPSEPDQKAADDHGAVADRPDRDAGCVDRGRILADRAQSQTKAGAVERPISQWHQEEGGIGDQIVARDQMLVDRPDDRNSPYLARERKFDRAELGARGQLRRSSALRPDRVADKRCEAVGHHVDRGSRDDLIGALVDRGVAVDQ